MNRAVRRFLKVKFNEEGTDGFERITLLSVKYNINLLP